MSTAPIKLSEFKGEIPALPDKKIPLDIALSAINCNIESGVIKPIVDILEIQDIAKPGDIRSIYKIGNTWLGWTTNVDIVKAEGIDTDEQILYTGDSYPKSTNATNAITGVESSYPSTTYGLGVPAPEAALTVTTSKIEESEDYGDTHSVVSYCYTYIAMTDGTNYEESAPSPPTPAFSIQGNMKVVLSGFVEPGAGRNNVMYFRVYRSVAGTTTAVTFQLVPTGRDGNGDFLYNMTAGDATFTDLDVNSDPQKIYQNLEEDITTEGWDALPDTATGLCQYQNGILAAIYGQQVLLSEPGFPYAFPRGVNDADVDYSYNFAFQPVVIVPFNSMLLVLTTAKPFLLYGSDPGYQEKKFLDYNQACVGGACATELGVIYAGKSGLVLCDGITAKPISLNTWTKAQWQAMTPENLKLYYFNDKILGFYTGTANGFIYDFKNSQDIITIDLGTLLFYDAHIVPEDDTLNLLLKDDTLYYVYEWEAAATNMTWTWQAFHHGKSRPLHPYFRIDGELSETDSITLTIDVDGVELDDIVFDDELFRKTPTGYKAIDFKYKFVGTGEMSVAYLGNTQGDLDG